MIDALKPSSRRHILEITCYCESAKVAKAAKAAKLVLVAVLKSFTGNPRLLVHGIHLAQALHLFEDVISGRNGQRS
jgi:hypothetical protein